MSESVLQHYWSQTQFWHLQTGKCIPLNLSLRTSTLKLKKLFKNLKSMDVNDSVMLIGVMLKDQSKKKIKILRFTCVTCCCNISGKLFALLH